MRPATKPRDVRTAGRLLSIDVATARIEDGPFSALPERLRAGDVLVVNDAATLPASLAGSVRVSGEPIELRLLAEDAHGLFRAVLFGAGDYRTPTEARPPPPRVPVGAWLELGALSARVERVLPESPRLVVVRFDAEGAALWSRLYRAGKPVQYAYVERPLALWDVQTVYATRPWAAEAPSAGHPLSVGLLQELARRGVVLATVTHAAGLSSTGDAALDAALPLEERFEIPERSVQRIAEARARGGRVIAVGTSVVRALEGRALEHGALAAGAGSTNLRIGPGYRRLVVDGLSSGMHEPAESHYALLQAFAPRPLLERAFARAEALEFLGHEFGDSVLIV